MSVDFETSQGVVLREIIAGTTTVNVAPYNRHGRLDAFVFGGKVGVFVKYSTKRMSPWRFTFHIDQVSELLDLEAEHPNTFMVFVCGVDGLVTLDIATVHELVSFQDTEQAWLRIDRKPRTLYGLAGNRAALENKVARGVEPILSALESPP